MGQSKINNCLNCSYLLYSDTAAHGYRCGQAYFSVPPKERKAARMDTYPEVELENLCDKWKGHPDAAQVAAG
jgi:hypothetical protein